MLSGAVQRRAETEAERAKAVTRDRLEKEIEVLNLEIAAAEASQRVYDRHQGTEEECVINSGHPSSQRRHQAVANSASPSAVFLQHPGRDYLEAPQATADTGFPERPGPNYHQAKGLSRHSVRDRQALEPAASTKFPEQTEPLGQLPQRAAAGTEPAERTGREDHQRQMPAGSYGRQLQQPAANIEFLPHPGRDYLRVPQTAVGTGFLDHPGRNYQLTKQPEAEFPQHYGRNFQVRELETSPRFPGHTGQHGRLLQQQGAGTESCDRDYRASHQRHHSSANFPGPVSHHVLQPAAYTESLQHTGCDDHMPLKPDRSELLEGSTREGPGASPPPAAASSRFTPGGGNVTTDSMIELLQLTAAPTVELDVFSGNLLEYEYFRASFKDVVEKKVRDQRSKLMRLIKYTSGEAKELIKDYIHESDDCCFDQAVAALEREYGDPQRLDAAYMRELRQWPQIRQADAAAHRRMNRFLQKCHIGKRQGRLLTLDSPETIRLILSKFHFSIQDAWNKEVVDRGDPSFSRLLIFLERRSKLLSNPHFSRDAYTEKDKGVIAGSLKTFATGLGTEDSTGSTSTTQQPLFSPNCVYCKAKHWVENCDRLEKMPPEERFEVIKSSHLCFGCLRRTSRNHYASICHSKLSCVKCNGDHPTLLHEASTEEISVSAIQQNDSGSISLNVVPVILHHEDSSFEPIEVYALLDSCSQGTFVDEQAIAGLLPLSRVASISVKTVNGVDNISTRAVSGLKVSSVERISNRYGSSVVNLPTAYSRDGMPFGEGELATACSTKRWRYLKEIAEFLPEFDRRVPFALIIGANCSRALEPLEVIKSDGQGPFAVRTQLGWCVAGRLNEGSTSSLNCHLVKSRETTSSESNYPFPFLIKDQSIRKALEWMYNQDVAEKNGEERGSSVDDRKFMKAIESSTRHIEGHYTIPMPLREDTLLANNEEQVKKRCNSIRRKMHSNESFRRDYVQFMDGLVEKGYAEPCQEDGPPGLTWYVPHHGVYGKEKIRVVFDAAAKFKSSCLNESLIPGPDLTNSLVGVLLRFRKERVPFMADIEKMFYQVKVPESQRDLLRFLWWPGGDTSKPLTRYRMKVHIFGAVSSPGCSNYALKRTATDFSEAYPEASKLLKNNFYVDDLLGSAPTNAEAKRLVSEVEELCAKGGFNLTKFVVRDQEIVKQLPPEKVKTEAAVEIEGDSRIGRALGVLWNIENDTLGFRIELKDTPLSRRSILSTISSIFDPLGLAGPFVLEAKVVLQTIVKDKCSWDDPLSDLQRARWERCRQSILKLDELEVPRCFKTCSKEVERVTLHCFADASETGYGQASYLQTVYKDASVDVALAIAKSRVAPSKPITIPRLELTAAVVSSRMASLLERELDIQVGIQFWTDSKIVLGYIANESKRFRIFVANRVKEIRDTSSPSQWDYVKSEENPADIASRGISMAETEMVELWLNGPLFLRQDDLPCKGRQFEVREDDPELKPIEVSSNIITSDEDIVEGIALRLSKWTMIVRVVGWILRFIDGCRKRPRSGPLVVEELVEAKTRIVRSAQQSLVAEVALPDYPLKVAGKENGKRDRWNTWKLSPFLDEQGIMRVGGRLQNAPEMESNPVILHRSSCVARRIAEHGHASVKHGGRTSTIAEIRSSGYWIIGMGTLVRSLVYHCVGCRRLRRCTEYQKMAHLPRECFEPSGPFTHCGLDMFGPFETILGRKRFKRYVALFLCFASRAVHMEVTMEMSTDSLINALRRFICRRGSVRSIRCDNGTNFVGTKNELYCDLDHQKISDHLSRTGCDWITWKWNAADASHMGGAWERSIKTVKSILHAIFLGNGRTYNDEVLSTFVCEAEAVINSHPLTADNVEDVTIDVLTPSRLLTMKTAGILPPPGNFENCDLYSRKRWRTVQFLADQFWNRWRKEYVANLQRRQKWETVQRNFKLGDVVLLKQADTKRNQWPLAIVTQVHPSEDGLVRSVSVRTTSNKGDVVRPVHKLVLLVEEGASAFAGVCNGQSE